MTEKIALLDTSIQIDRKKSRTRADRINKILEEFDLTLATGISLLEFKATVISELILIYENLRLKGRFTVVRDALLEKNVRQSKLRSHIFNNIINVQAESSFTIDEQADEELAEKASLQLRQVIPRVYKWFKNSVNLFSFEQIRCTRAEELPQLRNVKFATNLPKCQRGVNKNCRVEDFVRENAYQISDLVHKTDSEQLINAFALIDSICMDLNRDDLSHTNCRNMGDCLIALEGVEATHAISTNQRDWKPLCAALNKEFVGVDYPEEKTL